MKPSFQSEHFTLHTLAKGVYAAIATEGGAAFSNAGLIDLGDRTLVFDAFENPLAAEDLLTASVQLTGRNPATVIISHFHPDHWAGLQVFAGSAILSTHATRQQIVPIAEEMLAEKQNPSDLQNYLRETEAKLAAQTDPAQRRSLEINITRQRHTLQALPTLEPTLPNQTFEGELIFHGTQRPADLTDLGQAHTISDCILRLPQDGIAFIGDIGFFQSQPFMPYGFPSKWAALLDDMANWEVQTFVPGHGPLGGKDDLSLEATYIRTLEDVVSQVLKAGGTVEDALRQTLPPPFDAWQASRQRFEVNVRSSYKRQSTHKSEDQHG